MSLVAPLLLLFASLAQDTPADEAKKELDRLKAENATLNIQLKELREELNRTRSVAGAELQYSRQMEKRLQDDLSQLEEKHVEAARMKKVLEDRFKALAPDVPLQGKVTAVANEIGLVVISIGADHGVRGGAEFTVYRGGEFVAKVVVDRTDRKWSAGKITLMKREPRVGDDVSNTIVVAPPSEQKPSSKADETYRLAEALLQKGDRSGAMTEAQRAIESDPNHLAARALLLQLKASTGKPPAAKAADDVQALRKELDDIRNQVRTLSDRVIPSWQDVGLATEEASEALRLQLKIAQGVLVRQVREGSPAARMGFKPFDVVPDVGEAQLFKTVKEGGKVTVYRRGAPETLQGERNR